MGADAYPGGSLEEQTAHEQPSVGTPMLVPRSEHGDRDLGHLGSLLRKGFACLHEAKTQFSQRVFNQTLLVDTEIPFCLVSNH